MDRKPVSAVDVVVKKIGNKLTEEKRLDETSRNFSLCKTDLERVVFVSKLKDIHDLFREQSENILQGENHKGDTLEKKKSNTIAEKFRVEGNNHFKRKEDDKALAAYSKSALYAEPDSSTFELGLAFANRSAVLLQHERFGACVADINRALHCGYPRDKQYKLLHRKAKCLRALKLHHMLGDVYHKLSEALKNANLDESKRKSFNSEIDKASLTWASAAMKGMSLLSDDDSERFCRRTDPKLPPRLGANPNPTFPSFSRRCDVRYENNRGRFVAAVDDISAGEVVMVERPFASVLLSEEQADHCHVCFVRSDVMLACDYCVIAMFCSEECKRTAECFHRHECFILHAVQNCGLGKFGHLALKAILVKDMNFFTNFLEEARQQQHQSICEARRGCNDKGVYRGDNYNTIYNLVGHTQDRKPADLFRRTVGALYLTHLLQAWTGFFGSSNAPDSNDEHVIASLVLRHLQSFPCNAHEVSELRLDPRNVAESLSVEVGAAIYGALSLFNHSCDPMVTRHFYADTCVVRSVRPVVRGAELSDNYGAVFAVQGAIDRRAKLRTQYFFECQCVACVCEWPLYPSIPHKTPTLVCPACRSDVIDDSCTGCTATVNAVEAKRMLALATEKYQFALKKLLLSDVREATRNFTKALTLFQGCVQLPWRDFNNSQEGLKQCYNIEGNVFTLPDSKKE